MHFCLEFDDLCVENTAEVTALNTAKRLFLLPALLLASGFTLQAQLPQEPPKTEIFVSVADQTLAVVEEGQLTKMFPISTSRFGVGDGRGSYRTPMGRHRICARMGEGLPEGAVFKRRQPTGEILRPDAPGRDPIVTRILWLEGLESTNQNARGRCIYIHGTPQESLIGRPMSFGCVRMRSKDVIDVFAVAPIGTPVTILKQKMPRLQKGPITWREIMLAENAKPRNRRDTQDSGPSGKFN